MWRDEYASEAYARITMEISTNLDIVFEAIQSKLDEQKDEITWSDVSHVARIKESLKDFMERIEFLWQ